MCIQSIPDLPTHLQSPASNCLLYPTTNCNFLNQQPWMMVFMHKHKHSTSCTNTLSLSVPILAVTKTISAYTFLHTSM